MGGRIWVESKPGEGSTLQFVLPLMPTPQQEGAPLIEGHLVDRRILIVDDNATNCRILTGQMAKWV